MILVRVNGPNEWAGTVGGIAKQYNVSRPEMGSAFLEKTFYWRALQSVQTTANFADGRRGVRRESVRLGADSITGCLIRLSVDLERVHRQA